MDTYLYCDQKDGKRVVFGPADRSDVLKLQSFVISQYSKTQVVHVTSGIKAEPVPIPKDRWPQGWESVRS